MYADNFKQCAAKEIEVESSLHLDVSIRSQGAEQVSHFVNVLLDGKINEAKEIYKEIKKMHFRMYVTHDFKKAKEYCENLYKERDDKRYGCISSSQNPKIKRKTDISRWFNDPRNSLASCCQMHLAQSEFDVEGLELDMPIIGWFEDLQWNGKAWVPYKRNYSERMFKCNVDEPDYRYRINTYRVFLTRGRDGILIYIPREKESLRGTYDILREVGIEELK